MQNWEKFLESPGKLSKQGEMAAERESSGLQRGAGTTSHETDSRAEGRKTLSLKGLERDI